jgi:hypothetical protein
MDDAALVRRGDAEDDVHAVVNGLAGGQGTLGQAPAKRVALEQLGDGVRDAALRPEIMNGEDVRMRERGNGLCLAFESREGGRILGKTLGQDFDGDVAVQLGIARAVDLPHSSNAKRSRDFVRPELRSHGEWHDRG